MIRSRSSAGSYRRLYRGYIEFQLIAPSHGLRDIQGKRQPQKPNKRGYQDKRYYEKETAFARGTGY
jgi:subtilisin-like proprotein convertase family protein